MSNLTHKAMIVGLSISTYTARKFDKKVSKEVTDKYGADPKAARTNKNLFPFEAPEYEKPKTVEGAARRTHILETLPWNDKGERILLCTNHMNYCNQMRLHHNEFETALPAFFDIWPDMVERSKRALNGLWKEEDFPSLQKLKQKYSFKMTTMPIPDEQDFRVTLQLEDLFEVRQQCREEVKSRVAEAMREPYRRLYEVVAAMSEKLNDPNGTFHKTLVSNVASVTDHVLKALDLDDDDLKDMGAKIRAGLCEFDSDVLRDNGRARELVGKRAAEVMKDLAAFMGTV